MKRLTLFLLFVAGLSGSAFAQPDSLQRRFTFSVAGHGGFQTGRASFTGLPNDRLTYQPSPVYGLGLHLLTRLSPQWWFQSGVLAEGYTSRFYIQAENPTIYPYEPGFNYPIARTAATVALPIGIRWQSEGKKAPLHLAGGWSMRWIETFMFPNEEFFSRWNQPDTSFTPFRASWGDPITRQRQLWFEAGYDFRLNDYKALRIGLLGRVSFQRLYEGYATYFPELEPTRTGNFQSWGHNLNLQVAYVFSPRPFIHDAWAQAKGEMRWYAALEAGAHFNRHRVTPPLPPMTDHFSRDMAFRLLAGYEVTSRWALEAGLQYLGLQSGLSYDLGEGRRRQRTGFRDPFGGVIVGAAWRVVDQPRIRLGITGHGGLYVFNRTPSWISGLRFTDQSATEFLTAEANEVRFRATLPMVQAGLRPEWRIWKNGTAWLYLHTGVATGFGNVGGMEVDYQYNINPDPFSASYGFSGQAFLLQIGTRVYVK